MRTKRTIRHKTALRTRQTEAQSLVKNPRLALGGGIATTLGVLSLLSIALILLSLGTALALNSQFGIEPLEVYRSPFDLLVQAYQVVLAMFVRITSSVLYVNLWQTSFLMIGPLLTIVFLLLYHAVKAAMNSNMPAKIILISPQFSQKLKKLLKNPYLGTPVVTLMSYTGFSILTMLVPWIFLLALVAISLLPLIGFANGKQYFYESVIAPERCELPKGAALRRSLNTKTERDDKANVEASREITATCLRILKEGKELGRGRRIIHTYDTLFLFNPNTGVVSSIPTKDAVIEQINKLE